MQLSEMQPVPSYLFPVATQEQAAGHMDSLGHHSSGWLTSAVLWSLSHCKIAAAMSTYEEELMDWWEEKGAGGHQQHYLSTRI